MTEQLEHEHLHHYPAPMSGERGHDAADRIAYKGEPGPWGFKPQELEAAIRGAVEA